MEIAFDPAKRDATLRERGLDFVDAEKLFAGRTYTQPDLRFDYGEARFQTVGFLNDRMVMVSGRRVAWLVTSCR
ncbi:MAG: BrnT family toxin [Bauldia sp.]